MLYDITRTVSPTTAVFPGDTHYRAEPMLRLADGNSVNLVTLTTTPHVGTHADAPFHYLRDGMHPDSMPLEPFMGLARVVTVTKMTGAIMPHDLPKMPCDIDFDGAPRVLIHTWYSDLDDAVWDDTFPYPDVTLIDWLAGQGVILIGIDTPSFDDAASQDLPGHHALGRNRIYNLENLMLRGVPDGIYELSALPLKLAEACASPVRAVLRSIS